MEKLKIKGWLANIDDKNTIEQIKNSYSKLANKVRAKKVYKDRLVRKFSNKKLVKNIITIKEKTFKPNI